MSGLWKPPAIAMAALAFCAALGLVLFSVDPKTPEMFAAPIPKRASNKASIAIIYNRVPKCGSTTVQSLLKTMAKKNKFTYQSSKLFFNVHLSPPEEQKAVYSLHRMKTPWVFDRHVQLLNFTKFGLEMPHHINVFRDPAERRRSHYYASYVRNHRTMTFDECVKVVGGQCSQPFNALRYFCGHEQYCGKLGSGEREAGRRMLEIAKHNVEQYYDVVGITEDLGSFFRLLEYRFPKMMRGAVAYYTKKSLRENLTKKSHTMLNATRDYMKQLEWVDYEFYEFIKQRVDNAMRKLNDKLRNS